MQRPTATARIEQILESIAQLIIGAPWRLIRPKENLAGTVNYVALRNLTTPMSLEEANRLLSDALESNQPFMAGRFGSTELKAVYRSVLRVERSIPEQLFAMVSRLEMPFWSRAQFRNLGTQSGFFPINRSSVDRFVELMLESMAEVDLLASWVPGENVFMRRLEHAAVTSLEGIEPFHVANPWTQALEGKKVLVIHPFADSIFQQFTKKRTQLFAGSKVLPEFDLRVVKAVQSLDGPTGQFENWFQALDYMVEQSLNVDFDVAIVGCGAYGFPLAAQLKKSGKKVVHLGGVTQILFGIRGRRWDRSSSYNSLITDAWVRPLESETPAKAQRVDGGSYW